jgi:hypothetical protein
MLEPHDTLTIFAEVSIALAGFSGIVIAFGRRSVGSLSPLEIRRLSNLFILSGVVLTFSLVGITVLHVPGISPAQFWSWGSAAVCLVSTPWLIGDIVKVTGFESHEKSQINWSLVIFFDSMAAAMIVLQALNWWSIKDAWPFFVALTLITVGAFQQFILLVLTGIRQGESISLGSGVSEDR